MTRVADFGTDTPIRRTCLLDVKRNRIDKKDIVTAIGKPSRVNSRPSTNVDNFQRRRLQISADDFLRALEFQRSGREGAGKAVRFAALFIVSKYLRIEFCHSNDYGVFFSFAPANCPMAPNVVWAALSPSRKSLSEKVE